MGSLSTIDKDFVTERLLYLARETAHDAPEVSVVLLALAVPPEALPSNDVNHQRANAWRHLYIDLDDVDAAEGIELLRVTVVGQAGAAFGGVRPRFMVVSPGFFGSEVRRLVLRAFTEEPEEDPLTVPQALYAATMRSIPYIYEPKGSSFDVMPILPVSTLFSDDELDELQLKRKKRKDPRQTIVSVPSIRLMPGLAHPLTFNEEQMLRLFVTDPRSMAYNLSNTQRSRVPLTVEQCEMAHRIILERHEVLRSAFSLEDPNNPTRKVMRHHLGGFYALALPDEGSAQAIAAMDYATPHRPADLDGLREPMSKLHRRSGPRRRRGRRPKHVAVCAPGEETVEEGVSETLYALGTACVPGAFDKARLAELRDSFLDLSEADAETFVFGELRGHRRAVHLPFREPFSRLPLLGEDGELLEVLAEYLGEDFELESALIITVDGNTEAQNAHTDTEDDGSVSVHIPLQPLRETFAPLSLCVATHHEPELLDEAAATVRKWRCNGESPMDARKRLVAGTILKRKALLVEWDSTRHPLETLDLRLGKRNCRVRGLRLEDGLSLEALGLEVGDEITHVNDVSFMTWYKRITASSPPLGLHVPLRLRVLRRPTAPQSVEGPRLLVGAPLELGEAIMYDSRTIHWGMANTEDSARHVLYLNFMSSDFNGYSPDGDALAAASPECLEAREAFRKLGVSGIRMLYTPSSDNFPALHVNMHHILADNDALMTFWQESFQVQELLYYGFSKEAVKERLPKLPVQFTDFAYWQKSLFSRGLLKPDLSYWGREVTDSQPPTVLDLPLDVPRPRVWNVVGDSVKIDFDQEIIQPVMDRNPRITPFASVICNFSSRLPSGAR
ncbi:unnamed protein product [Durusdinium trenchii]|uniref:Uncharacterized protein n=1 Tax=Durusdinium trenchii TaxID=1381693 RepID=A0ABP0HU22_9DINO